MTLTKTIIYAAGRDAGNKSVRQRGLEAWDEEARDAAQAVFDKLFDQVGGLSGWMELPR